MDDSYGTVVHDKWVWV